MAEEKVFLNNSNLFVLNQDNRANLYLPYSTQSNKSYKPKQFQFSNNTSSKDKKTFEPPKTVSFESSFKTKQLQQFLSLFNCNENIAKKQHQSSPEKKPQSQNNKTARSNVASFSPKNNQISAGGYLVNQENSNIKNRMSLTQQCEMFKKKATPKQSVDNSVIVNQCNNVCREQQAKFFTQKSVNNNSSIKKSSLSKTYSSKQNNSSCDNGQSRTKENQKDLQQQKIQQKTMKSSFSSANNNVNLVAPNSINNNRQSGVKNMLEMCKTDRNIYQKNFNGKKSSSLNQPTQEMKNYIKQFNQQKLAFNEQILKTKNPFQFIDEIQNDYASESKPSALSRKQRPKTTIDISSQISTQITQQEDLGTATLNGGYQAKEKQMLSGDNQNTDNKQISGKNGQNALQQNQLQNEDLKSLYEKSLQKIEELELVIQNQKNEFDSQIGTFDQIVRFKDIQLKEQMEQIEGLEKQIQQLELERQLLIQEKQSVNQESKETYESEIEFLKKENNALQDVKSEWEHREVNYQLTIEELHKQLQKNNKKSVSFVIEEEEEEQDITANVSPAKQDPQQEEARDDIVTYKNDHSIEETQQPGVEALQKQIFHLEDITEQLYEQLQHMQKEKEAQLKERNNEQITRENKDLKNEISKLSKQIVQQTALTQEKDKLEKEKVEIKSRMEIEIKKVVQDHLKKQKQLEQENIQLKNQLSSFK